MTNANKVKTVYTRIQEAPSKEPPAFNRAAALTYLMQHDIKKYWPKADQLHCSHGGRGRIYADGFYVNDPITFLSISAKRPAGWVWGWTKETGEDVVLRSQNGTQVITKKDVPKWKPKKC